jgi:hypothetical protein
MSHQTLTFHSPAENTAMTILTLTDANINAEILQAELPILVLFHSPPNATAKIFEAYGSYNKFSNTFICGKINIMENPETMQAYIGDTSYGYDSLLLRFEHGKETYRLEMQSANDLQRFMEENYAI